MVKLIKVNENLFVNPEQIAYIIKNDFLGGNLIYFANLLRLPITKEEYETLAKQLK